MNWVVGRGGCLCDLEGLGGGGAVGGAVAWLGGEEEVPSMWLHRGRLGRQGFLWGVSGI